ncbi:MAG: hypothetical protein LBR65_03015 [Culturomica sp.]|jgi:hypothetical protein|nr:hypothetical protein [Culturomica sp.]
MENPFEEKENQVTRPTLLTVLCILTFIGSGWALLSNVTSYFTADAAADVMMEQMDQMEQLGEGGGSSFLSGLLSSSQEMLPYLKPITGITSVLALLSLLGAILMFRLRKTGFYLYTGAQILMLFVAPVFVGFSGMVVWNTVMAAILTLLFIILYSLNLKYMK